MSRVYWTFVRSVIAIALFGLAESRGVADPVYSVTNLGNAGWSLLNNNGQVAGGGYSTSHTPFSYTEIYNGNQGGQVTIVGVTPPSSSGPGSYNYPSTPLSMNDSGQVLVQGSVNSTTYELYANGTTTTLPVGSVAINNSGQVTGYDGYNPMPYLGTQQAFLQSGGTTTQLGALPGAEISTPVAINNSGEVVGNSSHQFVPNPSGIGVLQVAANEGWNHAFLYNGSKMVDLGTLGGQNSYAAAINNHGDVVGMSNPVNSVDPTNQSEILHAFLVSAGGKMVDLGTLAGTNVSGAIGINDSGQIVGWSGLSLTLAAYLATTPTTHAFIYQNGLMTDLNTLVPQNGVVLTKALAINNVGQILVDGVTANGNAEKLLLTPNGQPVPGSPVYGEAPVPEPSTLLVLAFGAVVFGTGWARKRPRSCQ